MSSGTYFHSHTSVHFERNDLGVLTLRLHSDDGPFRWQLESGKALALVFRDVADDADNQLVILTGTGPEFSGASDVGGDHKRVNEGRDSLKLSANLNAHRDLLFHLLRIPVPVIAAVNGPVRTHAEIPLLSDIVLASNNVTFQDSTQFINGLAPGDGQSVLLPMIMGTNRARYYLLTGQTLTASQAQNMGLVNEVVSPDGLIARAHALASQVLTQRPVVVRNTRLILVEQIKRQMAQYLDHALNLQALAALE